MLNKAILMGRLTADPELKQTPNGVSVTTFSLAINRTYNREITDFVNIVAWRQTAEFVSKYFAKGQLVAVEGTIQTRRYEDQQGNKRTAFEVLAEQVHFAESKAQTSQNANNFQAPSFDEPEKGASFSVGDLGDFEPIDGDDDDLPF